VSLTIEPQDMKFWSVCKQDWTAEPGEFKVMIGASSKDIKLHKTFKLR